MSRKAALLALISLVTLPSPLCCLGQDGGGGISARAVQTAPAKTEPGGTLSLSFRVTNRTASEEEFAESLRLPQDWQAAIPTAAFTLGPGETRTRPIALRIPAGAANGRYEIAYCVQGRRVSRNRDLDTVAVVVAAARRSPVEVEGKGRALRPPEGGQPRPEHVDRDSTTVQVRLGGGREQESRPPETSQKIVQADDPSRQAARELGQGKGDGVEVRVVSGALTDAEPGGIVSLSFRVTNRTTGEEEFTESLKLPPDWQPIIPDATFTLEPGVAQVRVVAIAVPAGAAQGRYEIAYAVRSRRDYAIQDIDMAAVVVPAVDGLGLFVDASPETVIAGDEYTAELRLVNRGNATLKVSLEIKSEDRYPAAIEPEAVTLGPGLSEPVTVSVKTDPMESRRRRQIVQIKAQAEENGAAGPSAGVTIAVEVIPRVAGKPDLRHRVPGELVLRAIGTGDKAGFQAELSGSGALDEAATRRIDFLLRGPDAYDLGVLGRRDEYRLNISTPGLDLYLGDQSFALSRLTDYYRYGKGLEIRTSRPDGSRELGAYYLKTRWAEPPTRQAGVYVSSSLGDRAKLRLNYLHRDRRASVDTPGFDDQVWSLECALQPTDKTRLQLEYGRSKRESGGKSDDGAYLVEWDGTVGPAAHYSLSKIHAGPDYFGYYRDSDYTQAAVSFPLGDRLWARASYQRWKQNLRLLPDRGRAPKEDLWRAGLRYRLPSGWYVSLDYDDLRYRDLQQPSAFDSRERPLRLGIGRSSPDYNFRLDFRGGERRNFLTRETRQVQQYSLYASYRSTPRLSFTAYCQVGDKDQEGSRLLGGSNNAGVSAKWQPTDSLFLQLYYLKYNFGSGERRESEQAQLVLSYLEPNGSAWTLEARRGNRSLGGRREDAYALSHTIPLGVPVGTKTSVGSIEGRLYDAGAADRPGIARAILTANGSAAVTDQEGRFVFASLRPGTYSLSIDHRSIGLHRVTETKTPTDVEVEGGRSTKLELGVVDAANLSGVVAVLSANGGGNGQALGDRSGVYVVGDPENGADGAETRGLPNVTVELTSSDETLRTLTDRNGEFRFEGVRPASWRVRVAGSGLPPYHYVEEEEIEVELGAGESERITIEVLPRLRRIEMIGEDEASEDGSNELPTIRPTGTEDLSLVPDRSPSQ